MEGSGMDGCSIETADLNTRKFTYAMSLRSALVACVFCLFFFYSSCRFVEWLYDGFCYFFSGLAHLSYSARDCLDGPVCSTHPRSEKFETRNSGCTNVYSVSRPRSYPPAASSSPSSSSSDTPQSVHATLTKRRTTMNRTPTRHSPTLENDLSYTKRHRRLVNKSPAHSASLGTPFLPVEKRREKFSRVVRSFDTTPPSRGGVMRAGKRHR